MTAAEQQTVAVAGFDGVAVIAVPAAISSLFRVPSLSLVPFPSHVLLLFLQHWHTHALLPFHPDPTLLHWVQAPSDFVCVLQYL